MESSLVYEAEDDTFIYLELTEGTIKYRVAKHKTSYKHPQYRNNTELSKKVTLNWKIIRARLYSGGQNCDLCMTEKRLILKLK